MRSDIGGTGQPTCAARTAYSRSLMPCVIPAGGEVNALRLVGVAPLHRAGRHSLQCSRHSLPAYRLYRICRAAGQPDLPQTARSCRDPVVPGRRTD
jgi:hypothetical protein